MKLEVGMYVRTKLGSITKIENEVSLVRYIGEIPNVRFSHNIIDLIEVGDYVNGEKVGYIDDCDGAMKEYYYDYEDVEKDCGHYFEEIKSIVTKEQFESMKYEVN